MGQRPDNRAAWNGIAAAYQERDRGPNDRLSWGIWCPDESELRLLGDVRGKRCLVLGCGGGEDCVALARMGAAQVIGIDLSGEQLAYARRLAEDEDVAVRLIQGTVGELSAIESESIDTAISAHALLYVERIDRCFGETYRVLAPGGLFAFSFQHPSDTMTDDDPPYAPAKSYFQVQLDWEWNFPEAGVNATFRSWYRPVSEWFQALIDAGFTVERILEPPPPQRKPRTSFERRHSIDKARLIPQTLIFRARKPERP